MTAHNLDMRERYIVTQALVIAIKELEKVDPAAVKRARTFFPFGVDKKDPKAS